jgi:hypothetical protein
MTQKNSAHKSERHPSASPVPDAALGFVSNLLRKTEAGSSATKQIDGAEGQVEAFRSDWKIAPAKAQSAIAFPEGFLCAFAPLRERSSR